MADTEPARLARFVRWFGLLGGPVVALAVFLLLSAFTGDVRVDEAGAYAGGLSEAGRVTAAVGVWMAVWWLTEAIPIPATALLPIALFPMLGVTDGVGAATAGYANPIIYLFLGGFVLGLAMEKWGLHKRIALITIGIVGTSPARLIGGFMIATAMMSMFVSNTATVVMMLPIAMSVVGLVSGAVGEAEGEGERRRVGSFAVCLLLGVAYAASIGGVGTLIGTPPNTILAGFLRDQYGVDLGFAQWMKVGIPIVVVLLPLTWVYLTRFAFPLRLARVPGGRGFIRDELRGLGPMSRGEWNVFVVFCLTAGLWVFRPQLAALGGPLAGLSDTGIAIAAALVLFVLPVPARDGGGGVFTMDWQTAERLPWGILILFGGGLALASAVDTNGVDEFIGLAFAGLTWAPTVLVIGAVAATVIFLTELTSNTAVTAALMPVLASAAGELGIAPDTLLVPAAIAASCAFMLPVATPPNAIVFSSGQVSIAQMAKAGLWLNVIGSVLITVFAWGLVGRLLGLELG